MKQALPIKKEIVLIGGGHAHALFIKMWRMKRVDQVRVTLISDQLYSPYSGMLPGLIAGHYDFDEIHIDLIQLCQMADVRFIQGKVTGIDAENQTIEVADYPTIRYDIASINIGSTPSYNIPGAEEFSVPVKPIASFWNRWSQALSALQAAEESKTVSVIGSGAGGVELILAMQKRLQRNKLKTPHQFKLITSNKAPLQTFPRKAQLQIRRLLARKKIKVITSARVTEISQQSVTVNEKDQIASDFTFLCTQASAAQWPKTSGLTTNEQGFICVDKHLQVKDTNNLFAVGDIAHSTRHPRPKAGVFAVRQAPILHQNILQMLLNKPLRVYKPQSHFLSLVSIGGRYALGVKRQLVFVGRWVWWFKDWIDRGFMTGFIPEKNFDPTKMPSKAVKSLPRANDDSNKESKQRSEDQIRCAGCGSKVGPGRLTMALEQLHRTDIQKEDAALIPQPKSNQLLQSVDQIRAMISDPYQFARIATLHALSDLFAMNARPESAQALLSLPYGDGTALDNDLNLTLAGCERVLADHHCSLVGGHTNEATEASCGFVINGSANPADITYKSGAQPGDKLILTKALGTGLIFAALMRNKIDGRSVNGALQQMLLSNQPAADIFTNHQVHACTDITGFGLIGHLIEVMEASERQCELTINLIPSLPGVEKVLSQGILSSLFDENFSLGDRIDNLEHFKQHPFLPALFDPQTSGGLLASLPSSQAEQCLDALQAVNIQATIIGEVLPASEVLSAGTLIRFKA